MFTLQQLFAIAQDHAAAGRLSESHDLCQRILTTNPRHAQTLHLLGQLAAQSDHPETAIAFFHRALAESPQNPATHLDLGRAYLKSRHYHQAASAFHRALELAPQSFEALEGLALTHLALGQFDQAQQAAHHAITLEPISATMHECLGDILERTGHFTQAAAAYQRASEISPQTRLTHKLAAVTRWAGNTSQAIAILRHAIQHAPDPQTIVLLGAALAEQAQFEEAASHFRAALAQQPAAETFVHLGNVLLELGRGDQAVHAFRQALALAPNDESLLARIGGRLRKQAHLDIVIASYRDLLAKNPHDPFAYFGLGVTFYRRRQLDGAVDAYRAALALQPNYIAAHNNLGLALKSQGLVDAAIASFEQAIELDPSVSNSHSNLLYTLHFQPGADSTAVRHAHHRWAQLHVEPLKSHLPSHSNDRDPNRRLKIGYVSPNLYEHPVGRFVTALFSAHSHDTQEIFCYTHIKNPDAITERIRRGTDVWVDTADMSDDDLAQRIANDRIDILIDLTMHMANTRLGVFARKPAPVQMTYLAYPSTTGVDAIDYRLTDPYLDPPESTNPHGFPEQPLHLPATYWCYDAPTEAPPVSPLPALAAGHITFGSLNNFCKVSPAARALWRDLLGRVPHSHLILHAHEGSHRLALQRYFEEASVAPHRIHFVDFLELPRYLALHHAIDIGLDPFPYPGGTTTCDALWMGVPVISLVGHPPFTRAGLSILSNIGLSELATTTEQEYLTTALALAHDLPRLSDLRSSLRHRMSASPLMDAPRFAHDLETLYRTAWRRWCRTPSSEFTL